MTRLAFLLGLLTAGPALAADYCALGAEDAKAVPEQISGSWEGSFRGGIVVQNGKPQALPPEAEVQKIVLTAEAGKLALADPGGFFPRIDLDPAGDVPDYALPGESPLAAAEFFQPETAETGIACDPAGLPQFKGQVALDGDARSTFRILALTPDRLALVIRAEGQGQAARVVFDLRRAGQP
ncbi:hypothetical protein GC209_04825 [bacterium]|nr:hypothetical protein [bacterium]